MATGVSITTPRGSILVDKPGVKAKLEWNP